MYDILYNSQEIPTDFEIDPGAGRKIALKALVYLANSSSCSILLESINIRLNLALGPIL